MDRDEILKEIARCAPPDLERLLRQIEAGQRKEPIAARSSVSKV